MNEFDALAGGVEYGGVRNRNETRILVCYIIANVAEPMTKAELTDNLQATGLANYFEIGSAVDSLIESGLIYEKELLGEARLFIREEGRRVAKTLEGELSKTLREKSIDALLRSVPRARAEKENTVIIEKKDDGVFVTFIVYSFSEEILKLTLYAADDAQAEVLKEGFLKNPASFYTAVIDKLTSRDENGKK